MAAQASGRSTCTDRIGIIHDLMAAAVASLVVLLVLLLVVVVVVKRWPLF